jgi:hypothetical protein
LNSNTSLETLGTFASYDVCVIGSGAGVTFWLNRCGLLFARIRSAMIRIRMLTCVAELNSKAIGCIRHYNRGCKTLECLHSERTKRITPKSALVVH